MQDSALAHRCILVLGSCTIQITSFDFYNVEIPRTNVYSNMSFGHFKRRQNIWQALKKVIDLHIFLQI